MCKCPCLSCATPSPPQAGSWRIKAFNVLFGSQSLSLLSIGFNAAFIVLILTSVVVVLVDSVPSVKESLQYTLSYVELCFTILFTLEYVVRLLSVEHCWMYMISFMGVIDFVSSVPALFALLYTPLATLVLLRILKISRTFRIFKLIGVFKAYGELLATVERCVPAFRTVGDDGVARSLFVRVGGSVSPKTSGAAARAASVSRSQ